jgi:membrane-associated phospholipid phosphatase
MTSSRISLASILLISLAVLVIISVPIVSGGSLPGDMRVLLAAMSFRNSTLTQVISILTFMGSAVPTVILCAGLALVESRWMKRSQHRGIVGDTGSFMRWWWPAAWPLIAYGGALVTNIVMRVLIGRLPPQVDHIAIFLPELQADFQRFGYPSGHAVTVVVAYGAMAITARHQSILSRTALIFAVVVIFGVGFGRLYLGVHWPSDVLAGYIVAAIWLLAALIVTRHDISAKVA